MKGASLFLSLIPVQVNKGRIHHLEINNYTKNIPTWAKEHSFEPGTKPNGSHFWGLAIALENQIFYCHITVNSTLIWLEKS